MTIALIGETRLRPQNDRVPVNIDEGTRQRLVHLLHQPWMTGVGYSEFIDRAIRRAYEEAEEHGA